MAVKDHVQKLIKYVPSKLLIGILIPLVFRYRPSKKQFPIIVSQDCDSEGVKNEVEAFGDQVQYIKVCLFF